VVWHSSVCALPLRIICISEGKESGWGRRKNFTIPVFPDGIEALAAELFSNGFGRTFVGYLKLRSGPGLGAVGRLLRGIDLNPSSPDGVVEVICACAGVAARFGVGTSGNVRDAEGKEAVAEGGRFPGGKNDADRGEGEAKGTDELNELPIGEGQSGVGPVPVIPGMRSQAWEGDGELCLPAVLVKVLEVGGK